VHLQHHHRLRAAVTETMRSPSTAVRMTTKTVTAFWATVLGYDRVLPGYIRRPCGCTPAALVRDRAEPKVAKNRWHVRRNTSRASMPLEPRVNELVALGAQCSTMSTKSRTATRMCSRRCSITAGNEFCRVCPAHSVDDERLSALRLACGSGPLLLVIALAVAGLVVEHRREHIRVAVRDFVDMVEHLRAERNELVHAWFECIEALDVYVDVPAVLGDLRFGHDLEREPRAYTRRVDDVARKYPVVSSTVAQNQ